MNFRSETSTRRSVTRSMLALAIFATGGVLLCAAGSGQCVPDGAAVVAKDCSSPKKTCTTSSDCQPSECCTATGADNKTQCMFHVVNNDGCGDTLQLVDAHDVIQTANGGSSRVPGGGSLPITAVTNGSLRTTCVTGGPVPCNLGAGDTVTFLSNEYVIQPTDPNPLMDQGNVAWNDLCDVSGTTTGCNPNFTHSFQPTAFTTWSSGCGPGPCTPTPAPTVTPTPTVPPTPTPTPKPTKTPKH